MLKRNPGRCVSWSSCRIASSTLVAAKLAAVLAAWGLASLPVWSALAIWGILGGHVYLPETVNLLFGHLCYGLLVGAMALFAAAHRRQCCDRRHYYPGLHHRVLGAGLHPRRPSRRPRLGRWALADADTASLRAGTARGGLVVGIAAAIGGFSALAAVWLPPGVTVRAKLVRSLGCVLVTGIILGLATQLSLALDVTEDQRNSFAAADQRTLAQMQEPLVVTVHLAPEDPRYADLQRNVLAKLARTLPHVTIRLASGRYTLARSAEDEAYGEVEYVYDARSATSRSTSPREVLALLYDLAQVPVPTAAATDEYPGYPLVANGQVILPWFCGGLPLVIVLTWWWTRRPPRLDRGICLQEISYEDR